MIRVLEPNKDYIIRADRNGIVDDVIEYKHGHWVHDWDIGCSVCSECGDSFLWEDFNGVGEFNYCPTCGCKMDEVTDV